MSESPRGFAFTLGCGSFARCLTPHSALLTGTRFLSTQRLDHLARGLGLSPSIPAGEPLTRQCCTRGVSASFLTAPSAVTPSQLSAAQHHKSAWPPCQKLTKAKVSAVDSSVPSRPCLEPPAGM